MTEKLKNPQKAEGGDQLHARRATLIMKEMYEENLMEDYKS